MEINPCEGKKSLTIDAVLAFAIAKEEEATRRYQQLAQQVMDPELSDLLRTMAFQEEIHRQKLEAMAAGDLSALSLEGFLADPVAEMAAVAEPGPDASLAQVLLFAVNAEQQAFQIYMFLAAAVTDPGIAALLRSLAEEEDQHRKRLERMYREVALR